MSLEYEGSTIETDENGYLVSLDDWSEGVADKLALDEDIEMNDQHWDITHKFIISKSLRQHAVLQHRLNTRHSCCLGWLPILFPPIAAAS